MLEIRCWDAQEGGREGGGLPDQVSCWVACPWVESASAAHGMQAGPGSTCKLAHWPSSSL